MKVLGVQTAQELALAIVSVGLAQNTGALRALAAEGLQKGYLSLRARNIAIAAGANADKVEQVAARLKEAGHVPMDVAQKILAEMRAWRIHNVAILPRRSPSRYHLR